MRATAGHAGDGREPASGRCYVHHSPPGHNRRRSVRSGDHDSARSQSSQHHHVVDVQRGRAARQARGERLFAAMTKVVHRYDTTRPITCAMKAGWLTQRAMPRSRTSSASTTHPRTTTPSTKRNPDNCRCSAAKTTNEKTTRGEYADDRPPACAVATT